MYDLYKVFYNLNIRFRNLLVNSSLPIKINLSFISKSNFEHFNKDFILPNMHRITSLRVSNPMIYDLNISPTHMISKFVQLKRLFLDQIESIYMEKILRQLISLPFLTSLTIFTVDCIKNINALYLQIFNLPALKYCQLSLKEDLTRELLPIASNQHSSIE
ncbi:unnamed protein product [Rotaria sp. Silwood2]|nr:unnamed protein product [Rotaria sp. Silwood2]